VQDWPVPLQDVNDELLRCGACGGYLGLVAQVLSMYSFLPACETFRLHLCGMFHMLSCEWHFRVSRVRKCYIN
jgi:hypothetical protein